VRGAARQNCDGVEIVNPSRYGKWRAHRIDTLIVPGFNVAIWTRDQSSSMVARKAPDAGVCSVCIGSFCLQMRGCLMAACRYALDARATARDRHPRVSVEPDAIFVRDGRYVLAGVTTG